MLHEWKHLLCDWWFQNMITWYDRIKSMTNIESYSQGTFWWYRILYTWVLCIIQKASSKPWKCLHAKTIENGNMIYITHQNLRYDSWFKKNECIKYLHGIFIKVPKSPTESTRNIKSRSQAVFGNTVLNHCE